MKRIALVLAAGVALIFTLFLVLVAAFPYVFAESRSTCDVDPRCTAAVDIDGAPIGRIVHDTIRRPFMFLLSGHDDATDPESRHILTDIHAVYGRIPADRRASMFIRGANHFTFSDDGALLNSGFVRLVLRLAGQLHIDGRRQLELTSYCLRTFFETYLTSAAPRASCTAVTPYPELRRFD